MKLVLMFLFTFSLFADFASATVDLQDKLVLCDNLSLSLGTDSVEDSSQNSHTDDNSEHCHCHASHSHIVINSSATLKVSSNSYSFTSKYPDHILVKLSNYVFEMSRPPIV